MVAPLLKWPGGKTRELPAILAALPDRFDRLIDPFVGGGALLFALPPAVPAAVNDASVDLVELYRRVQRADPPFLHRIETMGQWWHDLGALVEAHGHALVEVFLSRPDADSGQVVADAERVLPGIAGPVMVSVPGSWADLTNGLTSCLRDLVPPKLGRMRAVERRRGHALPIRDVWRNVEGAVRAAVYTAVRAAYNGAAGERSAAQAARFLFLREFAYAAMFRFNRQGEFNVPYGGITYNRKSLAERVTHLRSEPVAARLDATDLSCGDFETFLHRVAPGPDDVVFLDPPYDSDFSAYDRCPFGREDHRRLAEAIRGLPCRFQLVIKDTPLVRDLYVDPQWHVRSFDLAYGWTIKGRNDRATTHLLITDVDPADLAEAG